MDSLSRYKHPLLARMLTSHFRSHASNLTDDELSLLDVMFDGGATPSMLRQCNISAQFNVKPHSLDDASLKETVRKFLRDGIVKPTDHRHRGHRYIRLTERGADLWSLERCPVWDRFCKDRECGYAGDKTIMSCLLYTSPSPRDATLSRMPSSA